MAWMILAIAGLFETAWAVGLKYSESFTKPLPSVITIVCLAISMVLLGYALRSLPLGTAYAVWTGIGAVGAVIAGIFLFHEPVAGPRLFFAGLVVVGIIGLKYATPA